MLEQIVREDRREAVLERVDRRRGERRQQDERDVVPELRQVPEQIEDGEVAQLLVRVVRLAVARVRDHAHDAEEHHQHRHHHPADREADAHVAVRLGGEDALPRALVEERRGDDGDPERDEGLAALGEPARRVVELLLGDLVRLERERGHQQHDDERHDGHALELVREDGGRQAREAGVRPREDDDDGRDLRRVDFRVVAFGRLADERRVDVGDRRELGDDVDVHVEARDARHAEVHEAAVADQREVHGREAALAARLAPHDGTQPA
mmetsp:Transcript_19901/g.59037  ORF Transcript_19901/g.59037 Transcript_19901/m.59037 type:complete len:267 (-) Transcript_19901:590-1390(-)